MTSDLDRDVEYTDASTRLRRAAADGADARTAARLAGTGPSGGRGARAGGELLATAAAEGRRPVPQQLRCLPELGAHRRRQRRRPGSGTVAVRGCLDRPSVGVPRRADARTDSARGRDRKSVV